MSIEPTACCAYAASAAFGSGAGWGDGDGDGCGAGGTGRGGAAGVAAGAVTGGGEAGNVTVGEEADALVVFRGAMTSSLNSAALRAPSTFWNMRPIEPQDRLRKRFA
jgi:hypothetical protein